MLTLHHFAGGCQPTKVCTGCGIQVRFCQTPLSLTFPLLALHRIDFAMFALQRIDFASLPPFEASTDCSYAALGFAGFHRTMWSRSRLSDCSVLLCTFKRRHPSWWTKSRTKSGMESELSCVSPTHKLWKPESASILGFCGQQKVLFTGAGSIPCDAPRSQLAFSVTAGKDKSAEGQNAEGPDSAAESSGAVVSHVHTLSCTRRNAALTALLSDPFHENVVKACWFTRAFRLDLRLAVRLPYFHVWCETQDDRRAKYTGWILETVKTKGKAVFYLARRFG
jgi:hypothetical protein